MKAWVVLYEEGDTMGQSYTTIDKVYIGATAEQKAKAFCKSNNGHFGVYTSHQVNVEEG